MHSESQDAKDYAGEIESAINGAVRAIVRFFVTLLTCVFRPANIVRHVSAERSNSDYSSPLFFLVSAWLVYAATNATVVAHQFLQESGPVPKLSTVMSEGMSIGEIVLASLPLALAVTIGTKVFSLFLPASDRIRLQAEAIASYSLATTFCLVFAANALYLGAFALLRDDAMAILVLTLTLLIMLSALVAPILLVMRSILHIRRASQRTSGFWIWAGVTLAAVLFIPLGVISAQSIAILRVSWEEPILRLIEPVKVTAQEQGIFMPPETWEFTVTFTNPTDQPLLLTKSSCTHPDDWIGMSDLRVIAWSGDLAEFVLLPPSAMIWMTYEVSILGGESRRQNNDSAILALECVFENGASVFQALEPSAYDTSPLEGRTIIRTPTTNFPF